MSSTMVNDKSLQETTATESARSIEAYRSEFPILERMAYLNSNSLGALSRRSIAERRSFEDLWNAMGASAWYGPWMEKLEEVRAAFGRTIGAAPRDIALMPSVSAALAAVAGAVDFTARERVVITELDFPTVGHQFLSRRRLGVELEIVESPDGVEVPLEAIARAVDDRTALLVTSHVFFTSGAIQDAGALASLAHSRGALFVLDAYQSSGQVPIDVGAADVDILVSGALKWLMGGPGLAFMYVRPDLGLQPTTLSWFGTENQFAFDIRDATPRDDARRFEMGTLPVGAAYTAAGGLQIVEEIGIARIRERNAGLAEDLLERLRRAGLAPHVAADPACRSALILVRHFDPPGAVRWLAERDVIVDCRGPYLRFSPHFYNTVADNERAAEALARMPAG